MNRRYRDLGSSALEFTLVGVPVMFLLICVFEMSRAMWSYQSLAYAVKEGGRYAVVHGQTCTIPPNSCTVTIGAIATTIRSMGRALPDDAVTLTFTPSVGAGTTCLMRDCIANYTTAAWPAGAANAPGENVKISAVYPFRSAMAMFWPGMGSFRGSPATVNFAAVSRESIQY